MNIDNLHVIATFWTSYLDHHSPLLARLRPPALPLPRGCRDRKSTGASALKGTERGHTHILMYYSKRGEARLTRP